MPIRPAPIDNLEPRMHLTAVPASPYEQYMLELVNRARMNPAAEASRHGITLNEGLPDGTLSTAPRQPLANNLFLNDAARTHANWLRANNLFQHTGSGGSTPQQRMAAAGYTFNGGAGSLENLALTLGSSLGNLTSRVETLFSNLFVDSGVAGRSHRANLLAGAAREMGSGIATGSYTYNGGSWYAILANQNFAYNSGDAFITGVAFNDTIRVDNFYTPGEAMPTVNITATSTDNTVYSTNSSAAGGYAMRVPPGIYTIKATWAGKVVTYSNVVVGSENIKRDFKQADFAAPVVDPTPDPDPDPDPRVDAIIYNGVLWITGTEDNDEIEVTVNGNDILVQVGLAQARYSISHVSRVFVESLGGNDSIILGETLMGSSVVGGEGNDTIRGTANSDTLYGNAGDDIISAGGGNDYVWGGAGNDNINTGSGKNAVWGGDGNDRLNGSNGVDRLYGEGGNDRLYGQGGDDFLDGGGHVDRLYGGLGHDTLNGGSSNDRLYGDGGNDLLIGSKGNDGYRGGVGYDTILDREPGEIFEEIEVG